MKIGLIIAYNGLRFSGWQRQPGQLTVQGALEDALTKLHGGTWTEIAGASRTDAGVHAEAQLACFETCKSYDLERWVASLNALTPPEIQIRKAFYAPEDFVPRFASEGKHYRYLLWEGFFTPPMMQGRCMRTRPLDIEKMREGAQYLLGSHDFSSFRAIDCQAKTAIRRVTRIEINRLAPLYAYPEEGELSGNCVQIDVFGEAFLKQMVRIMVGTLLEVGKGKHEPSWVGEVLEGRNRILAGDTAQPQGLTLLKVFYHLP